MPTNKDLTIAQKRAKIRALLQQCLRLGKEAARIDYNITNEEYVRITQQAMAKGVAANIKTATSARRAAKTSRRSS